MKKRIIIFAIIIAVITAVAIIPAELFMNGFIKVNPSKEEYAVRGVDVSSYQGKIDWQTLSEQGIDFAFIKATEGSSFADRNFEYNCTEVRKTPLRWGAYHFFSYDSSGDTQADNFIKTVPVTENMLPPVIDLEFYGDYTKSPKSRDEVAKELHMLLQNLTAPIFQVNMTTMIYG